MALSDNIRAKRIERGMTMEELGKAIGTTAQQIYKYENNLGKPQPERFVLLAEVLGTSCKELVKGDSEVK